MSRPSKRDQLVTSGMHTVHQRGFASVGLREITAAAGVPQGSFTNHFASKEAFGLAVLDQYFDDVVTIMEGTLRDLSKAPLDRLRFYFEAVIQLLSDAAWRYGCLAGNMALEATEHSDDIRTRLNAIFADWAGRFAEPIRCAQEVGHIGADVIAEDRAAALLDAWYGAMLRMKIERTSAPIDRFMDFVLPALLGLEPAR